MNNEGSKRSREKDLLNKNSNRKSSFCHNNNNIYNSLNNNIPNFTKTSNLHNKDEETSLRVQPPTAVDSTRKCVENKSLSSMDQNEGSHFIANASHHITPPQILGQLLNHLTKSNVKVKRIRKPVAYDTRISVKGPLDSKDTKDALASVIRNLNCSLKRQH
ncbi:hypothetical protein EDEG_02533 [Edhazardia aedis USNM 41457]|uniref:Uncharacterized protein n=1 Tax=Edhazardia aedis (strain USNM 41457) TaxID=1003232 RepID=J9D5P4_EDHAE|nr:hypothetical protein EDEG_02533 [Edhazardia aedis USNM 41457]|eukprot:EJW03081.1 hypothetical protein EDEG_02533 [Edhazardia aedis USNM 41457]